MMDIYLRREQPRRGCLPAAILLAGIGLVGWCCWKYVYLPRQARALQTEPAAAEAQAPRSPATTSAATPSPAPSQAAAPTPAPAPAAATVSGGALLAGATELRGLGDLPGARSKCLDILRAGDDPAAVRAAEAMLGEINMELVTTPRAMPEKVEYIVEPGDSLDKLAKKFNTTVELIRRGNNLRGSIIRAGDRLRIFNGTFSITVWKNANELVLYMNGDFFKRYRVGTGQYGKTPVGDFTINDKIAQPTWWRPDGKAIPYGDTNNVLGTHWLSLDAPGYGLHGTWEPETIGTQASAGCVRLLNEEIAELYMLVPQGTTVKIVE